MALKNQPKQFYADDMYKIQIQQKNHADSNSAFKEYKTVVSFLFVTLSQLLVGKNTDMVAAWTYMVGAMLMPYS